MDHPLELNCILARTDHACAYGWGGYAFVHVTIDVSPSAWKRIIRSLPGPRNCHRLFRFRDRDRDLREVISVTRDGQCREYITQHVSFTRSSAKDRITDWNGNPVPHTPSPAGGQLTITFPQNVALADVAPGSTVTFLRRQWVEPGFGFFHPTQQSDDVRGRGSCGSPILEFDGQDYHEFKVEFPGKENAT